MRGAWPAGVLMLVLLAGCARPLASDEEPSRPSVSGFDQPFFGELVGVNGTMRVTVLPNEAGSIASPDQAMNCFVVEDADQGRTSFLGGFLLDLEWSAASDATARLNVTMADGNNGVRHWEGTSPMNIVLGSRDGEEKPFRTPLRLTIAAPGVALPFPDQPVAWDLQIGILESAISKLRWTQCGTSVDPPILPAAA